MYLSIYRGADKSLARPGRNQAQKPVRDTRDFNNTKTWAVIKFFFFQGKVPKEIHAILTETLAVSFLVGLRTYQHPYPTYLPTHTYIHYKHMHAYKHTRENQKLKAKYI